MTTALRHRLRHAIDDEHCRLIRDYWHAPKGFRLIALRRLRAYVAASLGRAG